MKDKNQSLIKRGTCILTEKPFIHVLSSKYRKQRCDFCFKLGKVLKCSNCNYLYYCNRGCQMGDWSLHKHECNSFKKIPPLKEIPDAARIISRIILKLKNGGDLIKSYYTDKCYRKFKDLMSHYAELKNDPKRTEHLEALHAVLVDILGDVVVPNKMELLGIYGRLITNGFNILDPEMHILGTGIYLGVSVTDHSCVPNAVATFEGTTLFIRVTEDLPCLDWSNVFISYVDLLSTSESRRKDLKENYYFLCTCSRCVDPHEPLEVSAAACLNSECNAFLDINSNNCLKCNRMITKSHRNMYQEAMIITKSNLERMKEIAYLDVCKICLNKQKGVFHKLNLWHVKTLDAAFESAINVNKWEDALEFGIQLIPGFRKYYGDWNPLLGLLYMKVGKILLYDGKHKDALKYLNEAKKIIEITHGSNHSLYKEQLIPLLFQATVEMKS